ncbi:MAG: hypothetical protein KAI79_08495 [Bacteroidales bacterium]|nr:hypothetical protein [Bacteroidales bacterium]
MEKLLIAAVFTFIGVVVTFTIGLVTNFINSRNNSKNLFVKTITKERATWREKLREETAEFCKIGYALTSGKNNVDIDRLRELGVLIRLRMNPNPDKEYHKEIIEDTRIIADKLSDIENNKEEITIKLVKIEKNIQQLLKQAWEDSKEEARTGKLA